MSINDISEPLTEPTLGGRNYWTIDYFTQRVETGNLGRGPLWSNIISIPEDKNKTLSYEIQVCVNEEKVDSNREKVLGLYFFLRDNRPLPVWVQFSLLDTRCVKISVRGVIYLK